MQIILFRYIISENNFTYWTENINEAKANSDLERDWDEEVGDRMVKLVFIGQKMDKKAICEELDKCLAK